MKTSLTLPVLLLLALGCRSTGQSWESAPTVDESLMAYVPEGEHEALDEARTRRTRITEQLAAARRDQEEIESQHELAQANDESFEKRVATARDRVEHAREYGTNDELARAQEARAQAERALRYQQTKLGYYTALEELTERRVALLEKRAKLADARMELAKAKAVSQLDRPIAEGFDIDDYQAAVEGAAYEVERARIEALAARERADLCKSFAERSMEEVPSELRFGTLDDMHSVVDSRAYEKKQDVLEKGEVREASTKMDG